MKLLPNRRRRRIEPPQRPTVSRPPSPLPDPADMPKPEAAEPAPDARVKVPGGEMIVRGGNPFGAYPLAKPSDEADALRDGMRGELAILGLLRENDDA